MTSFDVLTPLHYVIPSYASKLLPIVFHSDGLLLHLSFRHAFCRCFRKFSAYRVLLLVVIGCVLYSGDLFHWFLPLPWHLRIFISSTTRFLLVWLYSWFWSFFFHWFLLLLCYIWHAIPISLQVLVSFDVNFSDVFHIISGHCCQSSNVMSSFQQVQISSLPFVIFSAFFVIVWFKL